MKHFIVYDGTGTILRFGICQNDMVAAQASGAAERAIEGKIEFAQFAGARVDVTTRELILEGQST